MPNQAFPPVPPTPREYWEDNDWANAHIAEIAAAYPNLWVAVVDKQVIASGKIIADVRKAAETKTGKTHFPVVFAERGIHVYTGQSPFSNQAFKDQQTTSSAIKYKAHLMENDNALSLLAIRIL
ncbi:hypothetical protein FBQ85_12620 [Cytophagia bacterium CHB2]|nr:hypothetical protein [Cytophagia bacterium CHB2]